MPKEAPLKEKALKLKKSGLVKYHTEKLKNTEQALDANAHVLALIKEGSTEAIDALIKYGLTHRSSGVVEMTTHVLGKKGVKRAVPGIIKLLNHKNEHIVQSAIVVLGALKDKRATKPLIESGLKHKNRNFISPTAVAIRKIGDKSHFKELAEMLESDNDHYQEAAARTFAELKDKRAIDLLVEHGMTSEDTDVIGVSVYALTEMKSPHVYDILVDNLKNGNVDLAEECAWGIGELGYKKGVKVLIEHGANHKSWKVVKETITGLGQLGGKRAVDTIIKKGLAHKREDIRKEAIHALGDTKNKRALPALMKLAGHKDLNINKEIKDAIAKIQGAQRGRN